jgi:hypothetical protein
MPGSHLKFVRTLDFGVLDGLGMRAAAEIRDAEDALIADEMRICRSRGTRCSA